MLARVNAHLRRVESHRQPDGSQSIEVGPLTIDPEQAQAFVDGRPVGLRARVEVLSASAPTAASPCPASAVYREGLGLRDDPGRPLDTFSCARCARS